ncbi:Unknown protein, partial [Striga hermonthica]
RACRHSRMCWRSACHARLRLLRPSRAWSFTSSHASRTTVSHYARAPLSPAFLVRCSFVHVARTSPLVARVPLTRAEHALPLASARSPDTHANRAHPSLSTSWPVSLASRALYSITQFRDYHAEKFSGQGDPRIVDEWIQGLEFIFEVMDCPDRYRVICAQLQLTGDARLWWNAYWSMRPGEKAGCTWDMLKELVREKYYPSYYWVEMERQFLSLQLSTRTVDEYEREFTRLAAF